MSLFVHRLKSMLSMLCGIIMISCGLLFIRGAYVSLFLSGGQAVFCSALLAALLLLTGGGLLFSTVLKLMKKPRSTSF